MVSGRALHQARPIFPFRQQTSHSHGMSLKPMNCLTTLFRVEESESKRHPNPSRCAERVLTAWYWSRRWHQDQAHLLQQNYCSQCQPEYLTAETEERRGVFHIQLNKQKKSLKFLSELPSVKVALKNKYKVSLLGKICYCSPWNALKQSHSWKGENPTSSYSQRNSWPSEIYFWPNPCVSATWLVRVTRWIAYCLKHCLP